MKLILTLASVALISATTVEAGDVDDCTFEAIQTAVDNGETLSLGLLDDLKNVCIEENPTVVDEAKEFLGGTSKVYWESTKEWSAGVWTAIKGGE